MRLLGCLEEFRINPEERDSHFWELSKSGHFSAKSCYDGLGPRPHLDFSYKNI